MDPVTQEIYLVGFLSRTDPEVLEVLLKETLRQAQTLELIASENFTSPAVLAAMGSVLSNKYAEGYPNRRYYGGCEFVDIAEELARERAKKLFNAQHANVQPHSGTQANQAVYAAVMKPGETILSMELSHGGHLSHGSPVSQVGKLYNIVYYHVNRDTELIDYDEVRELAHRYKPRVIVSGYSAYPRKIDFKRFQEIADEVGAYHMADIAHIAGLVATGLHPTPVGVAQFVTSTTHKTLRGPRGGFILTQSEYQKTIDKAVFPGLQGGPLMHVIAAKAVAFKEALSDEFRQYQKQIVLNAKKLAETLKNEGLRIVSDGTDNHLMLVDLRPLRITGKIAEKALEKANITVNKNTIPYDPEKPTVTSGIRIGVPAVTTRGMKEPEMETIGQLIASVLKDPENDTLISKVRSEVEHLSKEFPLYESLIDTYRRLLDSL